MNALQSLKSISAYPIPTATLADIAEGAGLAADAELTAEGRNSREYRLALARVYLFLSEAPNVSQGGISYSFSEWERQRMRRKAEELLDALGVDADGCVPLGYKGEDL